MQKSKQFPAYADRWITVSTLELCVLDQISWSLRQGQASNSTVESLWQAETTASYSTTLVSARRLGELKRFTNWVFSSPKEMPYANGQPAPLPNPPAQKIPVGRNLT